MSRNWIRELGRGMAKKKNNHFVPKCYLKQFAKQTGAVCIYQISKRAVIADDPFHSQCQKDYYYGKGNDWEDQLSILESKCSSIFTKIATDPCYFPCPSEIDILREFVIYQRSRTVANNEYMRRQKKATVKAVAEMHFEKTGRVYKDDVLDRAIEIYLDEHSTIPVDSLEMASTVKSAISDMDFSIIDFEERLVTSDNPIIMINPFTKHTIGLGNIGLIIFFPITPYQLAVFFDKKLFPELVNKNRAASTCNSDLGILNCYQFINANQVVLSQETSDFSYLSDLTCPCFEARKQHEKQASTAAFGDADHKLIVMSNSRVIYDQELSFCRLCSRAKEVPLLCREPVPRIYDEAYIDKIKAKNELYPQLMQQCGRECTFAMQKEYRRGTQRMLRFLNWYWK